MENYSHFYISKTGTKYHLFQTCGRMKESILVNLNDKRLDKLSLCLKCEKRAEKYSQSYNKSYSSLLDSSFKNRKKIASLKGIQNYSGVARKNIERDLVNLKEENEESISISTSPSMNLSHETMIKKIENSNKFGEKTHALIIIGKILFNNGYETSFIAGLLANIKHEGNFGFFESSNYKTHPNNKPEYLKIMDKQYNYDKKYSGKYVYHLSLKELKEMCDKLKKDKWQKGKFGLGIIQWTGERTSNLIDLYLKEVNNADNISLDQVISAEGKMVINELKSNNYKYIYDNWKKDNISNLNSENAAFDAASKICIKYEVPSQKEKKAIERGNTAKQIYTIMTG